MICVPKLQSKVYNCIAHAKIPKNEIIELFFYKIKPFSGKKFEFSYFSFKKLKVESKNNYTLSVNGISNALKIRHAGKVRKHF